MESMEILDRLATRQIFQAIRALRCGGAEVTFAAVNGRLEPNEQALLAETLLAEESENQEIPLDYGRRCLESIHRSEEHLRCAELKAEVKQAERSGNLYEALRLSEELTRMERRGTARA